MKEKLIKILSDELELSYSDDLFETIKYLKVGCSDANPDYYPTLELAIFEIDELYLKYNLK